MLEASVLNYKYHRIILESVDKSITKTLKENYDYSFIVCMGDFKDDDYEIVEKKSSLIDLSKGLDRIIGSFNTTSRNEYRRTERENHLRFELGFQNFDTFYRFYTQCEHERGWFPIPQQELKNSLLFSATYNGNLISGMSCYTHGSRIRVGRIFSRRRSLISGGLSNTVFGGASKRIVVEICKFGIENGFTTLDLGGVDLEGGIKSGITQFKLSLGGIVTDVKLGRYMKKNFASDLITIRNEGMDLT